MTPVRGARTSVFATGFVYPRGLAFGPDGFLYVAEGGRGGASTTIGTHRQIPGPVGPYTGGMTGRISKIAPDGMPSTVAEGLPSSQSTPESGAHTSGVADVGFLDGALYALVAGGGASHGLPEAPNGIYRIDANGGSTLVANLSEYRASTTVANPDPNDDEYDGTWYSMVAADGAFFAVEPNHGDLVRVDLDGRVTRLADVSETQGHIVPTALAYRPADDAFYLGNLGRLPAVPGSAKILRIARDGAVTLHADGLTTVLGLAFGRDETLYAAEYAVGAEAGPLKPNTGRIVRLRDDRQVEIVATGLMFPTGMTAGPDGNLYVSTFGTGPAGNGRVERIEL